MDRRAFDRLAAALATVAAIAVIVVLVSRQPPRSPSLPSRSADAFIDSIGVNTHVDYLHTAYADSRVWMARLRTLGVHHVRDSFDFNYSATQVPLTRDLARDGIRTTWIVSAGASPPSSYVAVATGPLRGAVDGLEATNEPDTSGGPEWKAKLARLAPELGRALRGHSGVASLGPSIVEPANRIAVNGLARDWTVENIHPYPGGAPPAASVASAVQLVHSLHPRAPIEATETGYHNAILAENGQPPVSDAAAAVYVPQIFLDYFAAGVERTYLYELLDENPEPAHLDPEQHFGLLRADMSEKPAFGALRNLIAVVERSPGAGAHPGVTLSGATGAVHELLLDRRDGSRVLFLWTDEPVWDTASRRPLSLPAHRVSLDFPAGAADVSVYMPSRKGAPLRQLKRSQAVTIEAGPSVTAVSFR